MAITRRQCFFFFVVALFSKRAYSYLGPLHHTLTHREEQVGAGGG
jgi:hypothetical protein